MASGDTFNIEPGGNAEGLLDELRAEVDPFPQYLTPAEVEGGLAIRGLWPVRATALYPITVTTADGHVDCRGLGGIVNLNANFELGAEIQIRNNSSGSLTINGTDGQTINDESSIVLPNRLDVAGLRWIGDEWALC